MRRKPFFLSSYRALVLLGVVLSLVLAGCGPAEPPAEVGPAEGEVAQEDALHSPLSPTAEPEEGSAGEPGSSGGDLVPAELTPAPDLGIVHGLLLLDGEAAPDRTLYLAALIASGEQIEIAALDPAQDPRTDSDAAGVFVFLDMPPGRYALGINSPVGPVLIRGDDGDEIVAEVVAGGVVDLGTVRIVPFSE